MEINGLAHIGLFVTNIIESEKFYTEILYFKRIWYNENQTEKGKETVSFIQNGNLIIELVQCPKPEIREDGWFDHIAIQVKDIDAVINQLEKKGIVFEEGSYTIAPKVFSYGSKWILFRGPDGEHLELNEQNHKTVSN